MESSPAPLQPTSDTDAAANAAVRIQHICPPGAWEPGCSPSLHNGLLEGGEGSGSVASRSTDLRLVLARS